MYKSLEHIIREIKEGKCCCEKKKDSLEGAIRKVQRKEYESSYAARDSKPVDEDVGGLIGSGTGGEQKLHAESGKKKKTADEEDAKMPKDYGESIEEMNLVTNPSGQMTGRQFSTRSPIIAPRKDSDDGHGQAAKNVSVQRSKAIQKFSSKNVSLGGKISESALNEAPVKFKEKEKTEFKIAPVAPEKTTNLPATVKEPAKMEILPPQKDIKLPTSMKDVEDIAKKGTELAVTATPLGRLASIARQVLKSTPAGEKVSEFERQAKLGIAPPAKKTEVKTLTPEKPVETPKTETKPETKVQVPTTATTTKPVTPAEPKVEPKVETKPTPPIPPKVPGPAAPIAPVSPFKGGGKLPGMGFSSAKPVELTGPHPPVKTSLGKHTHIRAIKNVYKEEVEGLERKKIQNMPRKDAGDRHNIELVGRKDSDPKSSNEKTSRQAEYKTKIIDEGKKLAEVVKKVRKESGDGKTKVYDNVIINPDLNRIDNRDPQI